MKHIEQIEASRANNEMRKYYGQLGVFMKAKQIREM